MPRDRYIVLFIVFGFLLIPKMRLITEYVGVPFEHIFLTVSMLPISCMGVGLAYRGFLTFYLYPAKSKKSTGKEVFVDIISMHQKLNRAQMKAMRASRPLKAGYLKSWFGQK